MSHTQNAAQGTVTADAHWPVLEVMTVVSFCCSGADDDDDDDDDNDDAA